MGVLWDWARSECFGSIVPGRKLFYGFNLMQLLYDPLCKHPLLGCLVRRDSSQCVIIHADGCLKHGANPIPLRGNQMCMLRHPYLNRHGDGSNTSKHTEDFHWRNVVPPSWQRRECFASKAKSVLISWPQDDTCSCTARRTWLASKTHCTYYP